jgi:CO/xanthine dehydrogenase Mo-binding subunit
MTDPLSKERSQKIGAIGQSVTRLEDDPLVRGKGQFANDITFPNQLHMRMVRSTYAHGLMRAIDTAAARALPGVAAVWTTHDIADIEPIGFREGRVPELDPYRQYALATDRVRYVGEPVAAIFAENAYVAEDAVDLVVMDIEELPVITDASAEPTAFDAEHRTEPTVIRKGYGDVDAVFAKAHAVIELDLLVGRHSGVPMETRGAIARYDAARDVIEMYGAAKVPHRTRDQIARLLGRDINSVQLIEGHVGGGFGIRGELYPEDLLVCLAALRFRRPVKWIEDRREHLIAANHSRGQRHLIKAAVDAQGRLLAVDDRFYHDQGAYIRTHAARVADLTAGMLPGPYRVPAYRVNGHFRITNKTPAATYRSPGRYESTFVRERMMDAIAARLGIDPIAVRRRNLIASEEMPYARSIDALGEEVVYDSGDYAKLLDKTIERIGWAALQDTLAKRRSNGEMVGAGIGIFVEKSGLGPKDGVTVTAEADGTIEVLTGGASLGQGFETVMAQICADALDIDYRRVRVLHGRTDRIAHGVGAHASRATVMTGSATYVAAQALRGNALAAAAELLQIPAAELEWADGCAWQKSRPSGPSVGLSELATHVESSGGVKLTAEGWHHTTHMNYPYGIHVAVVCVDPGTGGVEIERYLIAYDVGRAVNPKLVEAQIVGGFSQGLGGALFEEFRYDERGEPLSTTFADYLLPGLHEVPQVDVLITEDAPSPLNPLGIKGAGEGGVTAVAAALAGAIDDAIGRAGAVTAIPITPQRIKDILRGKE